MSSCLSGAGGRTYALDLEIIKSPSYSTRTSHTSSPSPSPSPSSTLSEASNSPLAISTRKARTPRKRPKQTYNEAAALLSTAYPNIFSRKHLASLNKYTSKPPHDHHHQQQQQLFDESSQLLLPFRVFDDSGFLLHQPIPDKPRSPFEPKVTNFCQIKSCQTSGEVDFQGNDSMEVQISSEFDEDFDADSILDEEIGEGIDSIMGNLQVKQDTIESSDGQVHNSYCYGNPVGIGFGGKVEPGFGLRSGMRALRPVDEGDWWNFPIDVLQISPKFNHSSHGNGNGNGNGKSNKKVSSEKKKKKVEKEKHVAESKVVELPTKEANSTPKANSRELLLKLQYDDVLNAWSDKGSPFLDESLGSDVPGYDVSARLAQIDLFSEGGVREASVLRYKEKRRARLFSKKIRYQVRKVNADRRPRMKGRFVRRPNSSGQDEKGKKKAIMLSDL